MCSIHHEKKAIFIHIPKNAGSYISHILSKYYGFTNYYFQRPDHLSFCKTKDKSVSMHENRLHGTLIYYKTSPHLLKKMNMTIKKWDQYRIFCFVRNPYDRLISGWNYVNKNKISLSDFMKLEYVNDYDYWHVLMSQARHLFDINGKIKCNWVGRFESLEQDLEIILKNIGFKKINHKPFLKNNKKHEHFINYFKENQIDDSIINKIHLLFENDFKFFNYPKIDFISLNENYSAYAS